MKPDGIRQRPALLCLAGGALLPLSLAPFHAWWVAPLSIALFIYLLDHRSAAQALRLAWCYGTGLFAVGASWVYVSIHRYGYAPLPLALLLTALFVVGLGLVFALPFWVYGKLPAAPRRALLAFPALWVLGEWSRSWLLTGFPWLYLGYAHTDSALAGWFPITGVYGPSAVTVLAGVALHHAFLQRRYAPLLVTMVLFAGGHGLQHIAWTTVRTDQPLSVGIVQPNFSLHDKWNPDKRQWMRDTLAELSDPLWQQDLVVWPEAALPELYHDAQPFLQSLLKSRPDEHSTLVTGVLSVDFLRSQFGPPVVYNSIVAMGNGEGLYHKVRLVPFGEYVPLERWLRGLIRFFDLPTSHMSAGPALQPLLRAGEHPFSPFICYEIVYPDLVARNSQGADFLVTISNDSWFGDSLGPHQHLQMARARALESGRYVIRSTNDGISAIINPAGVVERSSQRFATQTLSGTFYPSDGMTPFMLTGSMPWMLLLAGLVGSYGWALRRQKQNPATTT